MKKDTRPAVNEPIYPKQDDRDLFVELLDRMADDQSADSDFLKKLVDSFIESADWVNTVRMEASGREVFVVTREMLVHFLRCARHEAEGLSANSKSSAGTSNDSDVLVKDKKGK